MSFNPRPPFRAGATRRDHALYLRQLVSILARPFERALHCDRLRAELEQVVSILARPFERALQPNLDPLLYPFRVSILARPFERALPAPFMRTALCLTFQSSPALSSGRYSPQWPRFACPTSFNPRPPFRAGATCEPLFLLRFAFVSILARPFERALHPFNRFCRSYASRFNPRPPFRAGAT